MNLKEIQEYSGGHKELEDELIRVVRRLEQAIGHPETMAEALSLIMWMNGGTIEFDELLRDPLLEPIGYRKAAAIVAALCDRFGLTQDEMLRAYHLSPLVGPEFERAEKVLREKLEPAGIPVMLRASKPKKRRRGKRGKGTAGDPQ
jgi:hypothetical protein